MKKLISLKDPETDEVIAFINLLSIDWYNELEDAWELFLTEIGGETIDDFIEYVNSETSIKIEKVNLS